MKHERKEAEDKQNPKLKRELAYMIREMEPDGDEDRDYVDFRVRLSSDFRRPLWSNYEGGMTYETLVHTKDALMTDYVDRGLSYVQARSHYSGERPGKIVEKSIEFVREGDLTFADSTVRIVDDGSSGSSMIKRWRNSVDRNLSIDYEWREWVERTDKDTKDTDIIVERWRMRGVSGVGNPADEDAGVMNERDLKLLREALQMDNEITDPIVDPVVDPVDPPVVVKREDTNVKPALVKDREDKPDYDAMRGFIDEDYDSAIKALGDKDISGSARTKIEELKGEAYGRLNHGLTYERGSVSQNIFEFLARHKEGGMRINEEFELDGEGKLQRDVTKNPMVRGMCDAYTHLERGRGDKFDLSSGVFDVARKKTNTRNAGAALEFQDAVMGTFDPGIRQLMEAESGIMLTPELLLRMQLANPNMPKDSKIRDKVKSAMRAFTVSGASGGKGGNLVQTDVLIQEFVDALYASAHTAMLGCRMLMGLTSKIQIPVQTGKLTESWLTETGSYTLSDATIGAVTAEPHRLAAGADVTFQLGIQVGGAVEDIILGILASESDEAIDTSVLDGAATGNDPTGVLQTSGISTGNVSLTNNAANNLARYMRMLAVKNALLVSNVPMEGIKWSVAAEAVSVLQGTPRDTTGGSGGYIMEGSMLVDVPAYPTSILSGDTATDEFAICADWSHSLICEFGVPILTEDPFTQAADGQKRMILTRYCDHIVTQASRFSEAVADTV